MLSNKHSNNHKLSLLTILLTSSVLLTACDSDSYDSEETPAPVVNDFPVQSALPAAQAISETGDVFTSETGLSLYFFANDEQSTSNCNAEDTAPAGGSADPESCAGRWPPLLAPASAVGEAPFTLVQRTDQTMQWAYKGFPLYTFAGDSVQGDVTGDGLGGVFDLARPTPLAVNENDYFVSQGSVLSGSQPDASFVTGRLQKDGFTLYSFDGDAIDSSACLTLGNGGCINTWPPLLADNGAKPSGLYGIAEIQEDLYQWTLRGKPLYFFVNDNEAGDKNGNTANAAFVIASRKPAAQRLNNDNSWLSANGTVKLLTFVDDALVEQTAVDKDQFSLYVFANDTLNTSNCNNGCLTNFPAFLAGEYDQATGAYGIIERDDGFMQWTFEGQPLYFATADQAIGDTNGHEVGNVWFLIPPAFTDIQTQDSALGETIVTQGFTNTYSVNDVDEFVSVLQDTSGRQLYTFDNDDAEQSACNSLGCIGNWPALLVKSTDSLEAPYSAFEREDGSQQIALNGKPLYLFTPDTQAGDQNGEGAGDVWFVARPAPMKLAEIEGQGAGFVAHRLDIQTNELNDLGKEGFTLYTFNNDVADSGVSNCTGGCAAVWPPLYADGPTQSLGSYSVIERLNAANETVYQWAYNGKPLYFFRDDDTQADSNGLVNPNFQIAVPE